MFSVSNTFFPWRFWNCAFRQLLSYCSEGWSPEVLDLTVNPVQAARNCLKRAKNKTGLSQMLMYVPRIRRRHRIPGEMQARRGPIPALAWAPRLEASSAVDTAAPSRRKDKHNTVSLLA